MGAQLAGQGKRRLTAILEADVANYSRLMEANEEATHECFKAQRAVR